MSEPPAPARTAAVAGEADSGRDTLGRPRLHLRRTDSTNDRARELAAAGAPHGTLVTAAEQTAGRGRHGRTWAAPANSSILMSLVLREPPRLLPLAAALAVCDTVAPRADGQVAIKWPNDVVVVERGAGEPPGKLAGILAEGRPAAGWAVLGIGVNVAVRLGDLPAELREGGSAGAGGSRLPAATLALAPADVEPLLALLLVALAARLGEAAESTLQAWRARDALLGREVAWEGGSGRAEGIDGLGRLVVALAQGGHTALAAGEVSLRAV
jgi:BirA family biotin operon repressor/biotin-[acetyl-CoA-carboxylase] ligase